MNPPPLFPVKPRCCSLAEDPDTALGWAANRQCFPSAATQPAKRESTGVPPVAVQGCRVLSASHFWLEVELFPSGSSCPCWLCKVVTATPAERSLDSAISERHPEPEQAAEVMLGIICPGKILLLNACHFCTELKGDNSTSNKKKSPQNVEMVPLCFKTCHIMPRQKAQGTQSVAELQDGS